MSETDNDDSGPAGRLRNWLKLKRKDRKREEALRDVIEEIIEEAGAEGEAPKNEEPMTAGERGLLLNIIRLRDLTARDVKVPRADIIAVAENIGFDELLAELNAHGHSRLPVYRESLDDVIGFIHIKDLIAARLGGRPFDLKSILRQVLFVAPSMRVLDLLLQMRLSRQHLALVIDEFGGTDGLVTI
ncbi:MAG TPA: CBS domain-containing protein, partial [Dongiaceae bacterium]